MTLLLKAPGLRLEDVAIDTESVSLSVASTHPSAACPAYDLKTARLHTHNRRTVADLPWGGRSVRLSLRVRRFRCSARGCTRRIFAEWLPSVVKALCSKDGAAAGDSAGGRLCIGR
jgi:transposase